MSHRSGTRPLPSLSHLLLSLRWSHRHDPVALHQGVDRDKDALLFPSSAASGRSLSRPHRVLGLPSPCVTEICLPIAGITAHSNCYVSLRRIRVEFGSVMAFPLLMADRGSHLGRIRRMVAQLESVRIIARQKRRWLNRGRHLWVYLPSVTHVTALEFLVLAVDGIASASVSCDWQVAQKFGCSTGTLQPHFVSSDA